MRLTLPGKVTISSTSVFQLWQSGHCPDHLGDCAPHCSQTYIWRVFTVACFIRSIWIKLKGNHRGSPLRLSTYFHRGRNVKHTPVKKAVFPVAGMGTRFLPVTKANPKKCCPS